MGELEDPDRNDDELVLPRKLTFPSLSPRQQVTDARLKDLAFYGVGLNTSIVLQAIGYSTGKNLYEMLYKNAVGMIILAASLPHKARQVPTHVLLDSPSAPDGFSCPSPRSHSQRPFLVIYALHYEVPPFIFAVPHTTPEPETNSLCRCRTFKSVPSIVHAYLSRSANG